MNHQKIKSLSVNELEKLFSDMINEKLGVKYSVNISSISYTDNNSTIDERKEEITNLTLNIVNKVSVNREYTDDDSDF